ncbi:MAG: hypothetical protein ACJAZP_004001, partial [Psychromonas sp.]
FDLCLYILFAAHWVSCCTNKATNLGFNDHNLSSSKLDLM